MRTNSSLPPALPPSALLPPFLHTGFGLLPEELPLLAMEVAAMADATRPTLLSLLCHPCTHTRTHTRPVVAVHDQQLLPWPQRA